MNFLVDNNFSVSLNLVIYIFVIFAVVNYIVMEFPTTDKQIKMWCLEIAYDDNLMASKIEGEDRIKRAERVYDFICSYQPSSPSGEQKKLRVSPFSRLKNFLRLKGRG